MENADKSAEAVSDIRAVAAYLPHGLVFHVNSEFVDFAYVTADGRAPHTTCGVDCRRLPVIVLPTDRVRRIRMAAAVAVITAAHFRARNGWCVRLEFNSKAWVGGFNVAPSVARVSKYIA